MLIIAINYIIIYINKYIYIHTVSCKVIRDSYSHREDSAESGKDILGSGKAASQSVPSV